MLTPFANPRRVVIADLPFVNIPKRPVITLLENHRARTYLEILQGPLRIRIIHYDIENLSNPLEEKLSQLHSFSTPPRTSNHTKFCTCENQTLPRRPGASPLLPPLGEGVSREGHGAVKDPIQFRAPRAYGSSIHGTIQSVIHSLRFASSASSHDLAHLSQTRFSMAS